MRGKRKNNRKDKGSYPRERAEATAGLPSSGLPFGTLLRPSEPRLTLGEASGELDSPTAAATRISTALVHPWDAQSSQISMMTEWYKRMRAINSGATNYDTTVLYSYFSIVRAARAAWLQACKMVHALAANEPSFVNNSAFFYYLCGGSQYAAATSSLADWTNKLLTQGKQLEAVTIPDFEILKNDRIVYGYVLREKVKRRSSYATHIPGMIQYATLAQTDGKWVLVPAQQRIVDGNSELSVTMSTLLDFIDTCMALISTTYVYSTLQGDMIKTFGLGAYQMNLLSWFKEGLHIDDTVRINRVTQNAGFLAIGFSSLNSSYNATTGEMEPELSLSSTNYPGYNKDTYPFVVDDNSPEEFYYYSLLRPVFPDTRNKLANRGYVMMYMTTLANGSTASSTIRFVVNTALVDAQSSTTQSVSETGHARLANLSSLWEYMPAYCPRGSTNMVVWHIDDVRVYSLSDMTNAIAQGIRKELDSKAFVAQSNMAKKN